MPATKTKPAPLFVCHESFANHEHSIARGTKLRGDSPIVERYPHYFIDANTPTTSGRATISPHRCPSPSAG